MVSSETGLVWRVVWVLLLHKVSAADTVAPTVSGLETDTEASHHISETPQEKTSVVDELNVGNGGLDRVMDALLDLLERKLEVAVGQRWAKLEARLDSLENDVREASQLVFNTSIDAQHLLSGQTRLENSLHQDVREVLRVTGSDTDLDPLQEALAGLQESVAGLQSQQTRILNLLEAHGQHRQPTECPSGWSRSGATCFLVPPGVASWYQAERICELMHRDAKLASVHPENFQHVQRILETADGSEFWIGLVRLTGSPGWGWADGTALDYTAWREFEPNNSGGQENCVQYYLPQSEPVGWNDRDCSHKLKMLCQIQLR